MKQRKIEKLNFQSLSEDSEKLVKQFKIAD